MGYLYEACDQISDFCHQQLLRKMRRKISWTDRQKTVYPLPPSGSGGIFNFSRYHLKVSQFLTFKELSTFINGSHIAMLDRERGYTTLS